MLNKFNCSEWHLGEEEGQEEEDISIELYRWKYREVGRELQHFGTHVYESMVEDQLYCQ